MLVIRGDQELRRLARHVIINLGDMTLRSEFLKLPKRIVQSATERVRQRFEEQKEGELHDWARSKGFGIEKDLCRGPAIACCQRNYILTNTEDNITIFLFVARPRAANAWQRINGKPPEEPPFGSLIKSPIGGPLSAQSPVEFEAGDAIVLEEGEQLCGRKTLTNKQDDLCALCLMYNKVPSQAGMRMAYAGMAYAETECVEMGDAEMGAGEMGAGEMGDAEMGAGEMGDAEMGAARDKMEMGDKMDM